MAGIAGPEYKIILLGEPGVGKTSFFYRLKTSNFQARPPPVLSTMTVEHLEYTVLVDGVEVKVKPICMNEHKLI